MMLKIREKKIEMQWEKKKPTHFRDPPKFYKSCFQGSSLGTVRRPLASLQFAPC